MIRLEPPKTPLSRAVVGAGYKEGANYETQLTRGFARTNSPNSERRGTGDRATTLQRQSRAATRGIVQHGGGQHRQHQAGTEPLL